MINPKAISFRKKFEQELTDCSISARSLPRLISAEWAHDWAWRIVSGHYDHSTTGPGVFRVAEAARYCGASLDAWLGLSLEESTPRLPAFDASRPSINDIASIYYRGDKSLEAFEPLIHLFDIYEDPTHGVKVLRVGEASFAANELNNTDPCVMQGAYDQAPKKTRDRIQAAYLLAWEKGFVSDVDYLDERIPKPRRRIDIRFTRTAARVSDQSGAEYLIVHCARIE